MNNIHHKVWDEITYHLLNFNGAAVLVWEWTSHFIPHFIGHKITDHAEITVDPC